MRVKDPERFAQRLAAVRLSQNELADQMQLSRSYLSAVARGLQRINDTDAGIIARKLGARAPLLFVPAPDELSAERAAVQSQLLAELDGS